MSQKKYTKFQFRFKSEMRMKFSNFMHEQFVDKIDTLKKFKVGQSFLHEINVQKAISLSVLDRFQQMRAQNLS